MKTNDRVMGKTAGFTIVELLTVMAVIAILIGLLVPALNQVHDKANDLQQRVQFHAIDVGLELYKSEYNEYPPSVDNLERADADGNKNNLTAYCGANKLAEALVGWDLLGFHPKSEFTAEGNDTNGTVTDRVLIYDAGNTNSVIANENIEERSDLFLELEKANAFRYEDLYDNATLSGPGLNPLNFVLCDSYTKRRAISGKKTGTPILYFRANTQQTLQRSVILNSSDVPTSEEFGDDVFNYWDNNSILRLGSVEDGTEHPLHDDTNDPRLEDFYEFDEILLNEQVSDIPVPFRAQSYVLMSAGKDGLFGNSDDIYNFEKEK